MNVVKREKTANLKFNTKSRNELVRKDSSIGIRGGPTFLPITSSNISKNVTKGPRYQFSGEESASRTTRNCMGPPLEPPRSLKRKIIHNSTSSAKAGSLSSARFPPRVLASDSAALDTSTDFHTPRNRPTALRYISSSSRGGHSGPRSARSTSTSAVEASVVLAISEGRRMARGEIGIAAVDLRHPHLVLCQFSDTLLYTHTLTKINYFNPIEIIVPHTFCEGVQPNQLYQLIKDQFPSANLTTVQRRHFNDAAGRQQIQTLCAPQYSAVYLQVLHKFYALTAAAAVLKYVEYIQCIVFARESLKIEYHSSEHTMIIDVGTATQLELVQPLTPSAGQSCCLLGVLGPTYTVGGIRALRAAILQPSCKKEFIENRLDAVQDLIENDNGLMIALQDVIKKLSEIDKILLLCMESTSHSLERAGEAQLNQTLLLKTSMEHVPKLQEALSYAEAGRLKKIKLDFENPHYKEISDRIKTIIQEDAHLEKGAMGSLQRCFAVKPDINGLLDVARRTYSELIEDIQKIVEQLSETYDLPVRLNQNMLKGFHIVLPIAPRNRRNFKTEDLPEVFIQVTNSGASVTMTTEELVVLDQQAKEALNEIQKMSNIVISGLLKDLRPFMFSLYKLCENVAELDILLALAHASTVGSYIRPDFSNYLDVRNSVHPLLDYNSQTMPVPNDVYASPEHNFTIVTGPNMGGKSIYIKQIAIIQIMAQVGCFVPATNATLRLCDRLFSRIGFNDSAELNASTFVLEMKEIQHILQGLTGTSLVIVDELCRGTCNEEGTSIAWAICEELIASDAFTFFTTHFIYLTRLQDLYFNVVNLQTTVTEEETTDTQSPQRRLVYQHKIEPAVTSIERYGLALAAKTNLPDETVKLAEELAELIVQRRKPQNITAPDLRYQKALYDLNADIRKETRKSANAEETVKQMLRTFKDEHPGMMERFRNERNVPNTDSSAKSNSGIIREIGSSNLISSTDSQKLIRNSSRPKQSKVVYSTSENENSAATNPNYTSVRSSNELLNTMISHFDKNHKEIDCQGRLDNDVAMDEKNSTMEAEVCADEDQLSNNLNSTTHSPMNIGTSYGINEMNNSSSFDQIPPTPKTFLQLSNSNRDQSTPKRVIPDIEMNDAWIHVLDSTLTEQEESDIAEALTQVLEEASEDQVIGLDSDEEMINDTIDEDLMRETVEEINEELANNSIITDIVLTPPLEFRD